MKRSRGLLLAILLGLAGCRGGKPLISLPSPDKTATSKDGGSGEAVSDEAKAQEELALSEGNITVRAQNGRVPVLMFHDVQAVKEGKKKEVWFDCSVEEFQQILDWIETNKLVPVSLDQLYGHLAKGDPLPQGSIVLTFDDNYQGFYDNAYPLLKAKNYPSAMFVHTDFVGHKEGRPKMDWPTLQTLVSEKLVTIGSHTLTHPHLPQLSDADQDREIKDSKKILEDKLGIKIDYFAYPDGENNAISQYKAREAGYKMAFTVENGPAEESPNLFAVNRYIQTRYEKALEDCQNAEANAPVAVVSRPLQDAPITYEVGKHAGIDVALIRGGLPSTYRSPARQGVLEFMQEAHAQAGINGTFFAMAEIKGTSNEMVGPVFTSNEKIWVPDMVQERIVKIIDRPLVIWSPSKIAYVPFTQAMNTELPVRAFMPDFTDAFVAGVWLVHLGQARTEEQLMSFGARDAMQPRRRAFFGTTSTGTVVLGASLGSVSAQKLAEAAAEAGVEEAVMMDSGFSTSLVYGDKVVASGHSTPETPSRPVPHAIVLAGKLAVDPATITIPQPSKEHTSRRSRRHRK